MAQRHIDIKAGAEYPISDAANAETLTNDIRVVFDNTTQMQVVMEALEKAKHTLIEILGPLNKG